MMNFIRNAKSWLLKNIITIDKETVRQINEERGIRYKKAAENLLAGNLKEAEDDLAWVAQSSELLSPMRKRKWFYLLGVLIFIFICLCNLHYATDISFEVETENVTLVLEKRWETEESIISDGILIDNLLTIVLRSDQTDLHETYSQETPGKLALNGEEIGVSFALPANSETDIKAEGNLVKFFVKGDSVSGKLQIQDAELRLNEDSPLSVNFEIPEIIEFETAESIGTPTQIQFAVSDNWQLQGLKAREIFFSEEKKSGTFSSVIRSGNIRVLENKTVTELHEKDNLILKGLECRYLHISKGEKGIKVYFEGAVSEVLAGPKGFEENLTLTWMEYIWNRKALGIFILALLSLLGKNVYMGD